MTYSGRTGREYRFITSSDKRSMFPTASALRCEWCCEAGFTGDRYFCKDICRGAARRVMYLTTKITVIDWDYIGQVWRAYGSKRS
jgi:hypothetical protein